MPKTLKTLWRFIRYPNSHYYFSECCCYDFQIKESLLLFKSGRRWWSVGFYLPNLIYWITLGVPRRSALFVGHATTSSRTPGCADHICNQSIDCTASCVLAENMLLLLHSLSWSILVLPMGKNCCMLNTHIVATHQTFGIKNLFIYLLKEKISLVPGSS